MKIDEHSSAVVVVIHVHFSARLCYWCSPLSMLSMRDEEGGKLPLEYENITDYTRLSDMLIQ